MTYDELLTIAQQLTAQEKLRLAQSLTQLACNDQREQNPSHSAENSLPEKSGDDPCFRNSHTMPIKVIDQNRPWVGNEYALRRIFVVGESYTGTYENELEYDDAYIAAWLAGKKVPGPDLFKKMAVKLELSEQALSFARFWR